MALVYATSPRGGCHNQGDYYLVDIGNAEDEIGMELFGRQAGAEKAKNVAIHQNWRTVSNAAVICIFGNVMPREYVALINAGCGFDWTVEEMIKVGERGWNLKRAINNRMGLTRENDTIPKPFLEPYQEGGAAGFVPDFDGMLRAYYEARDWDWETGFPNPEKLKSLGLDWVVKDLWQTT